MGGALINKDRIMVVSLDITKAYDLVWLNGLICKLKQIGVPCYLVEMINSFLRHRKAEVRVGKTGKGKRNKDFGLPQGSPLSPMLFLVSIND